MNAPTDKDYIDSKIETLSEKMLGAVRVIAVEMAGERKSFEAKMEGNIARIHEVFERRFTELNANIELGKVHTESRFTELNKNIELGKVQVESRFTELNRNIELGKVQVESRFTELNKNIELGKVQAESRYTELNGSIALVKEGIERRLAESTASQLKSNADTLKWGVGITVAVAGLALAYLTFIINNMGPRATTTPALVQIYTYPVPAATSIPPASAPSPLPSPKN